MKNKESNFYINHNYDSDVNSTKNKTMLYRTNQIMNDEGNLKGPQIRSLRLVF